MAKEKKKSSDSYIALTYLLTTAVPVFIISFCIFFAYGMLQGGAEFAIDTIPLWHQLGLYALTIPALWVGVLYGAYYVKKTYMIENSKKILMWAMKINITFSAIFIIADIIASQFQIISLVMTVIYIAVFYVLSKKYLLK